MEENEENLEKNLSFQTEIKNRSKVIDPQHPENSPFLHEYIEAMSQFPLLKSKQELQLDLKTQGIYQSLTNQDEIELTFNRTSQSINREIMFLEARWRIFSTELKIINVSGDHFAHRVELQNGGFGKIYQGIYEKRKIVVKCIPFTSNSGRLAAVEELFLLKIASAAKFGPKLSSDFGFDILMYKNCAEIAMQLCEEIQSDIFSQAQLYENLRLMHSLHLVHIDLKPQNIMFSVSYKKMVFIDFGLSKFIKEDVGQKSLTEFEGSLNYCSKQMRQCFDENIPMKVDLYYNDLCCLGKSISSIKSIFQSQQYFADQLDLFLPYEVNFFDHLSLFKLKYYLFSLKMNQFFNLWRRIDAKMQKKFTGEIFQFFFELVPCEQLKNCFHNLTEMCLIEQSSYFRMKLIYQIAEQKLCSIELLRNDEKNCLFQSYYSKNKQKNSQQRSFSYRQNKKELNLEQIMINCQYIKELAFKRYVELYLEYISYINNKHRVTSVEREKAAAVYYALHISPNAPQELKGKTIVRATIRHILKWMLYTTSLEIDNNKLAILAFRVLDFFIILQSESSQLLIDLVNSLFTLPSLTVAHKILFLQRVQQSSYLINSRIFLKAEESRTNVMNQLWLWTLKFAKTIQNYWFTFERMLEDYQISKKLDNWLISEQFIHQFGTEIMQQSLVKEIIQRQFNKNVIQEKYIELFNRKSSSCKHLKIFNFSLSLYEFYFQHSNSKPLCKKIFSIVKQNIGDPQIISEYAFQFQINSLFDLVHSTELQINVNRILILGEQIQKIHKEDLFFFNHSFLKIIQKIHCLKVLYQNQVKSKCYQNKIEILQNSIFLRKVYQLLSQQVHQELFWKKEQQHFNHIDFFSLGSLVQISYMLRPQKIDQIRTTILNQSISKDIKCTLCRVRVIFYSRITSLRLINKRYIESLNKKRKLEDQYENEILQQFYGQSIRLQQWVRSQKHDISEMISLLQIILNERLHLCSRSSKLEQKYHGIKDYFEFALKYDGFKYYFSSFLQFSSTLFSTMVFLLFNNYDQLIQFLIKITLVVEKSLLHREYLTLVYYFSAFVTQTSHLIDSYFRNLKNLHQKQYRYSGYVAILYTVLFKEAHQKALQRKLAAAIFSMVNKLHIRFQREVQITITEKVYKSIRAEKGKRERREKRFYNNKLLKLLMVEGKTKPVRPKHTHLKSKKFCLLAKMSKIEKMRSQSLSLTFQTK